MENAEGKSFFMIILTEENAALLKSIKAPRTVALPPGDAHASLCQLADGEIRTYGVLEFDDMPPQRCYLASRDYGLNWVQHVVPDDDELGPMVYNPYTGNWIALLHQHGNDWIQFVGCGSHDTLPTLMKEKIGLYVILSPTGPGTKEKQVIYLTDKPYAEPRLPQILKSRKRIICTAQMKHGATWSPVFLWSDDGGLTWKDTVLAEVPEHVALPPHKGIRFRQGACEPTVTELSDGRLMMAVRTSHDFHYLYYSCDGGETWSDPVPSDVFHATTTMPLFFRMQSGRLLFFWCNNQPLPELDHSTQWELSYDEQTGFWEDVFTNRDANHAALSDDDGKTWQGFREVALNEIRNHADYRSFRPSRPLDRSIHQFEAMELPFGKILLSFGQAKACRRMVIFDPEWLLEKERKENFRLGLDFISTHVFVKSLCGGKRDSLPGHCNWNRTNGALLIPSPDRDYTEVLQFVTTDDPRLFNQTQGAAWNFPAMKRGRAVIQMQVCGEPLRFSLTDRWFNPCDEFAAEQVQFTGTIGQTEDGWHDLALIWNENNVAILLDGREYGFEKITMPPAGFSYLLLQTTAKQADFKGSLIRSLTACAEP